MKLKERICKNKKCGMRFTPLRPLQGVCSPGCAYEYQKFCKENKEKSDWKKEKNKIKESLKTHKDYLKILQVVFNTFIRLRDKEMECVSCGCSMIGRKGDASHFYSVGANANLRVNEDNVHLACVPCNQHKHGNLLEYAERLPLRIGIERFEKLKQDRNKDLKLSIPEIQELILKYKRLIKEKK